MVNPISRVLIVTLLAVSAFAGEEPKCSGAARECEQQIRHMLSGRRYFGATIEDRNPGLVIKSVIPNSPAARAGLEPGDTIIAVNGKSLTQASGRDLKQIIADARGTGRLWMIISRRGAYSKVETQLQPYSKEQMQKIIAAHLAQSHTSSAGAN
jgi:predicted metalloprotease with PDZ domain